MPQDTGTITITYPDQGMTVTVTATVLAWQAKNLGIMAQEMVRANAAWARFRPSPPIKG